MDLAILPVGVTAGAALVVGEKPAQGTSAQPSLKLLIRANAESKSLSCRASSAVLTA